MSLKFISNERMVDHVNSFELPQDYFETGNLKNSKEMCYNLRQHTNHNLYTEAIYEKK